MEKIPFAAIQEGIDAFRHIILLEQRRAREQARQVALRQGARGVLWGVAAAVAAFAIHLVFFWATVALYQRGWSIGAIVLAVIGAALIVGALCMAIGSRLVRSAPLRSIIRRPHERTREDRTRTGTRKEAA